MAIKYKFGIKKGKIIKIYPHKISKKRGKNNYYISWKTTRKNLSNKTFHGKFYKSKEEAKKKLKKKIRKGTQKGGSTTWYDTYNRESNIDPISPYGYEAIRNTAFYFKYK